MGMSKSEAGKLGAETRKQNKVKEAQLVEKVTEAVTSKVVNSVTENVINSVQIMMKKFYDENEAHSERIVQEPGLDTADVGKGMPVDRITENDFSNMGDGLQEFMEEKIKVMVHESGLPGEIPVVTVCVNGKNQNFIRGREQVVRRKYVEALARTRTTTYDQKVQDSSKPENIQMEPKTVLTYPFVIVKDLNPLGRQWYESVIAQY